MLSWSGPRGCLKRYLWFLINAVWIGINFYDSELLRNDQLLIRANWSIAYNRDSLQCWSETQACSPKTYTMCIAHLPAVLNVLSTLCQCERRGTCSLCSECLERHYYRATTHINNVSKYVLEHLHVRFKWQVGNGAIDLDGTLQQNGISSVFVGKQTSSTFAHLANKNRCALYFPRIWDSCVRVPSVGIETKCVQNNILKSINQI